MLIQRTLVNIASVLGGTGIGFLFGDLLPAILVRIGLLRLCRPT